MHNEVIMQQPVNFLDLERAYSDFATGFISESAKKKQPFFLYYPSHVSKTESLMANLSGEQTNIYNQGRIRALFWSAKRKIFFKCWVHVHVSF